jgi:hypothetical protein
MITQSRQAAKRCRGYLDTPLGIFKGAALGISRAQPLAMSRLALLKAMPPQSSTL